MSNVKPGDFARVTHVAAPQLSGNVGALVYVERLANERETRYVLGDSSGIVWVVEHLQPVVTSHREEATGKVSYRRREAGSTSVCEDRYLKKDDPPGDWEDVFSEEDHENKIRVG